jgi:hypothetical protein
MNAAESKALKKGSRVYWRGNAGDSGHVTETSWDAVTIAWDNGHVATVHHGDMRDVHRANKARPRSPQIERMKTGLFGAATSSSCRVGQRFSARISGTSK